MAGRSDEVKEGVHTVVAESRVTLDTGLLGKNVVVLALEVARDLTETSNPISHSSENRTPHIAEYLSLTSPRCRSGRRNQGCRQSSGKYEFPPRRALYNSTVTSETRYGTSRGWCLRQRTDGDGLDPYALLNVCVLGVIGILAL